MDEGKQPLSQAEAQQAQAEQAVRQAEAQTGTTPLPRTQQNEDPHHLDSRFDPDDLRQGKPPPAVKKHKKLRIRRKRANKGAPLTKEEKKKAEKGGGGGGGGDGSVTDEGEMTDEEVELTDDEGGSDLTGGNGEEGEKKSGLLSKVLGKS